MSLIDHALKANEQFARRYDPKLGARTTLGCLR